ncbi:MAG TPA: DUF2784 domain-containing protein [Gemmataceae bacterium]|nr:DUF2784 domain-containing protein [Gemmataceae bacterium]
MFYEILADIVVGVHLAYVSYVVFGELLIVVGIPLGWRWIRNIWFRGTHLLMIAVVAAEALAHFTCPLTTWEVQLLDAAGVAHENRSFVGRLMHNWMFFETPADDDWIWPWIYCSFAGLVLLTFVVAPPRWRRAAKPAQS